MAALMDGMMNALFPQGSHWMKMEFHPTNYVADRLTNIKKKKAIFRNIVGSVGKLLVKARLPWLVLQHMGISINHTTISPMRHRAHFAQMETTATRNGFQII